MYSAIYELRELAFPRRPSEALFVDSGFKTYETDVNIVRYVEIAGSVEIPELVVNLYEKVLGGKYSEALNIQYKINLLRKHIAKLASESQEVLREIGKIRSLNTGYPPSSNDTRI